MSLVSGIGSPSATINGVIFLSHRLHLPDDTLDLYIETSTVTRYGQVVLSVIGFSFVTIAIPLIYSGKIRVGWLPAAAGVGAGAVMLAGILVASLAMQSSLFPISDRNRLMSLQLDPLLTEGVEVAAHRKRPESESVPPPIRRLSVRALQDAGVLRVGYNPDIIPFSYWNVEGDLVGFDVAFMHQLAADLGIKLEFIPFSWQELPQDLSEGRFDIAVSGIYLTHLRLTRVNASRAYYTGSVALIVPSDRASQFTSRASIDSLTDLRLAVFDDPVLFPWLINCFRERAR